MEDENKKQVISAVKDFAVDKFNQILASMDKEQPSMSQLDLTSRYEGGDSLRTVCFHDNSGKIDTNLIVALCRMVRLVV